MTERDELPADDADSRYMRRALDLAARGWGRVAPNPMVGAVLVRDGQVVGEGWHREFGHAHAEVEAIADAGDEARGATLYVSLEPCTHAGKTPPCTDAVQSAGVKEVVYACADPNPMAGGGGEVLIRNGLSVRSGIEEPRARALNAAFLRAADPGAPRRPWLELKLAMSLDGRVADLQGRSKWITGDEAFAEVHRLRAGYDAIAVGIGTALADDPRLTARGEIIPRTPPIRLVFDRNLRLPAESVLVRTADEAPLWIVASAEAPAARRVSLEGRGARIIPAEDLTDAARTLFDEGVLSIFCEGGATLAAALLRARIVDRLTLLFAPLLLGSAALDPFAELTSHPLGEAHRWTPYRCATLGRDTLISVDR